MCLMFAERECTGPPRSSYRLHDVEADTKSSEPTQAYRQDELESSGEGKEIQQLSIVRFPDCQSEINMN